MKITTIKKSLGYLLLILIAIFVLLPIMWAISASVTERMEVYKNTYPFNWRAFFPSNPTLEAYRYIFLDAEFGIALKNSFILCISTVSLGLIISTMAGFAFARFNFPGKNMLFIMVLLTFMVPIEAIVIPLFSIVRTLGWLYTWPGLIIPGISTGLVVFLFKQFFEEIPQELIDASLIDGASWLRILVVIFIPLSKPVLVSGALVMFITSWNSFFWPLVVAPNSELRVVQLAIARATMLEHEILWPVLFGSSVIATLIPIILIFPFQKYYVRGIAITGLKG